jgi:penicillin-binding protein 1B
MGRTVAEGEYHFTRDRWIVGRRQFAGGSAAAPAGGVMVRLDYTGRIRGLEDASGRALQYAALEPRLLGRLVGPTGVYRVPANLDRLPSHLIDAVLTIEDQRFFDHAGLDPARIVAATLANVRAGRVVQGGSTVTQQLAKNLYLTPRRTLVRKVREAAIALVLERRYPKEQILTAYLNEVYLGQDGPVAIHGIGAAAQHYFAREVYDLTPGQSALIAGMIRGPSLYSPVRNPEVAAARRDLVLRLMRDRGVIAEAVFEEAAGEAIDVQMRGAVRHLGRYFVDYVREGLTAQGRYPGGAGLAVFTTLDSRLQEAAEQAVADGLASLEERYADLLAPTDQSGKGALQAALVALDPWTGEVLAMVGGRDYGRSQFNRAADARRQPGSSFKPIVTLAALSGDDPFTLASLLADEPLSVETPAGVWRPVNYDEQFRGPITLREALERSLNVPFARLGLAIGAERIVETASELGIEGPLMPVPSLALGASEVSPLELTRAYGVLAAGGWRAELKSVLGVVDGQGAVSGTPSWNGARPFDARETYLVTSALRGVVARGTGRSLASHGFRGDVAAKSGTTNDFRDGWFIGYTPRLVIGVWVGFDEGRTIGLPGARVALPIFARFLNEAVGPYGEAGRYASVGFRRPAGLEIVEVDSRSGLRAGPGCRGEPELFLPGTAPRWSCSPYGRYRSRRAAPTPGRSRTTRNAARPPG